MNEREKLTLKIVTKKVNNKNSWKRDEITKKYGANNKKIIKNFESKCEILN